VQLVMRTLRQQSMSMQSRSVSILRLSMVRLSTPVPRIPNQPPWRMEISRSRTLVQCLRAIDLLPTPGALALRMYLSPFSSNPKTSPPFSSNPKTSPGRSLS
jgi:hypothetical protein